MMTRSDGVTSLSAPAPRGGLPLWQAILWLLSVPLMMAVMLYCAILPGNAVFAPGVFVWMQGVFIALAAGYGLICGAASVRTKLYEQVMHARVYGKHLVVAIQTALCAGIAFGTLHLAMPRALALAAADPLTAEVGIRAIRGGAPAEDGLERVVLQLAGHTRNPYSVTFAEPLSAWNRIGLSDALGQPVLSGRSTYATPLPATVTGARNALVWRIDDVTLQSAQD